MDYATIAIIASSDKTLLPDLTAYQDRINGWIGVERGALWLIDEHVSLDYAIGDFDSVSKSEKATIKKFARNFQSYPAAKDKTDLELAIDQAISLSPEKIYFFGTTGGRKDHELVNIQLLYRIVQLGIETVMIDTYNEITMTLPGTYTVQNDKNYPYISFIAFTPEVTGITLTGFKYSLVDETVSWGSTLCISNYLLGNVGTFSYDSGILLLIKSCEIISDS